MTQTDTPHAAPALLDKKQALEQAGGNRELACDLFSMLLEELPVLQSQLAQALEYGEQDAMWDPAHKLYGSTAYCGVPALREAARVMEECIKQQQADQLQSCFARLSREIARLQEQGPALAEQLRAEN
ncbi:MAG: Hpt domain-containing protein [Thiohalophilus sp.]|uniref:Hpt domain-containing protein n=1 Tax=Thiohalophilus sp. TaxID=3028392 RepID=UPI0028700A7F|nr:Hpt domain-containing protein [Thiohalophilus sp.]MDR9436927.1 Hpt domain-containing protein [Thiohalophilus sp.]